MSILRSKNRPNPYQLVVEHTQVDTKQRSALTGLEHEVRFVHLAGQVQMPIQGRWSPRVASRVPSQDDAEVQGWEDG